MRGGLARSPDIHVFNHQVNVERLHRDLLHALDHRKAKGQVRHEVAVHHVDVVAVAVGDGLKIALKIHKIGRKNARVDARAHVPRIPICESQR